MPRPLDVPAIRRLFPGLQREVEGQPALFFDGPAGSQVPTPVADAVRSYLLRENANHGGAFATSAATDAMTARARAAAADLFGGHAEEIVFGANMTTLTFHLAHALARTWRPGDEVVVTDSDHDANIAPWVLAARDAGATVQQVAVHADGTLDLADAERKLGPRTRLFAFGAASNLTGTIHPVRELCALARSRGALTYVDCVHQAPHARMDVAAFGCDFAVASAYKFFGPHLGILWGCQELLEQLEACRVRPAPAHGPEKWQTGTANFEGIAGTLAAIDYLAGLAGDGPGDPPGGRRGALDRAFAAIEAHEHALCRRLLEGLAAIPGLRVVGITDPARDRERCPTVSFVPPDTSPQELHARLGARGVFTWAGNNYALALTEALGLEPGGVLRVGILHYTTAGEVDRLLAEIHRATTGPVDPARAGHL